MITYTNQTQTGQRASSIKVNFTTNSTQLDAVRFGVGVYHFAINCRQFKGPWSTEVIKKGYHEKVNMGRWISINMAKP